MPKPNHLNPFLLKRQEARGIIEGARLHLSNDTGALAIIFPDVGAVPTFTQLTKILLADAATGRKIPGSLTTWCINRETVVAAVFEDVPAHAYIITEGPSWAMGRYIAVRQECLSIYDYRDELDNWV